eukprot:COSAG01_NODE_2721_length_7186_cov_3.571328_2_plen_325_part_00
MLRFRSREVDRHLVLRPATLRLRLRFPLRHQVSHSRARALLDCARSTATHHRKQLHTLPLLLSCLCMLSFCLSRTSRSVGAATDPTAAPPPPLLLLLSVSANPLPPPAARRPLLAFPRPQGAVSTLTTYFVTGTAVAEGNLSQNTPLKWQNCLAHLAPAGRCRLRNRPLRQVHAPRSKRRCILHGATGRRHTSWWSNQVVGLHTSRHCARTTPTRQTRGPLSFPLHFRLFIIMIRAEDETSRIVWKSQPLPRFLSRNIRSDWSDRRASESKIAPARVRADTGAGGRTRELAHAVRREGEFLLLHPVQMADGALRGARSSEATIP